MANAATNPRKPFALLDLQKSLKGGAQVLVYRMTGADFLAFSDLEDEGARISAVYPLILEWANKGKSTGEAVTAEQLAEMLMDDVYEIGDVVEAMLGMEDAVDFKPEGIRYNLAFPLDMGDKIKVTYLEFQPKTFAETKKFRRATGPRARILAYMNTFATAPEAPDLALGSLFVDRMDGFDVARIMFGFLRRSAKTSPRWKEL